MRINRAATWILALVIGVGFCAGSPSARGQVAGGAGSLGGFGGSDRAMSGPGAGGPMVIPYGGTFEGFMPSRMGGGAPLSFRSRQVAPMARGRSPFTLSPMSGGMSGMIGNAVGKRAMAPIGSGGTMGSGGSTGLLGGMRRMQGGGGRSVMPPSIGYPFRQPPSLVSPSSAGIGMSM